MKVVVEPSTDHVADFVHGVLMAHLNATPATVLGLPTGGTPIPVYSRLVDSYRSGRCSFRHATTFNLDEYFGLGAAHPAFYAAFMQKHLLDYIDRPPGQHHIPDGMAVDAAFECASYEQAIASASGLDLLLLGLGIADGIRVHPTTIRLVLSAGAQAGHLFLITDAMSQTGTDIQSFSLNGRTVTRADGALRLENGTLAAADLDMIDAIHFMRDESWIDLGRSSPDGLALSRPCHPGGRMARPSHARSAGKLCRAKRRYAGREHLDQWKQGA